MSIPVSEIYNRFVEYYTKISFRNLVKLNFYLKCGKLITTNNRKTIK
jgi:hypothetical protein